MREIKFRCYDERCKEMRYSNIVNDEFHISEKGVAYMYAIPKSEGYIGETQYYENYNCMRFTGLKDVNGIDIYEGDVVDIYGYGEYIVEFPFLELYEAVMENDIGDIIGNIHQNPELLEG